MFSRIMYVTVFVSDLDMALDFYTKNLGFQKRRAQSARSQAGCPAADTKMSDADLQVFEEARPRLLGLAYRILGSRADAEDAVQDCFKWRDADRAQVDQPYVEIAAMLEMDEAACRKHVSRGRQSIDRDKVRHVTPKETQDNLLRAFQSALNGRTCSTRSAERMTGGRAANGRSPT